MNLKKLISMACAVCLTLSLAIPANAAELTASNQRSSHAGTTVTCGITVCDVNTGEDTDYVVDVAIPSGATKAQESQLIRDAASSVNEAASSVTENNVQATDAVFDTISETQNLTIVASQNFNVGGGTLTDNYIMLFVVYSDVTAINGASTLSTTVTSDGSSGQSYTMSKTIAYDFYVYMYNGYGGVYFFEDDTVDVTATTNTGGAYIGSCEVWATTQDLG